MPLRPILALAYLLPTWGAALSQPTQPATSADASDSITPHYRPVSAVVTGVTAPTLSLNGRWRFHAAPSPDFQRLDAQATSSWPTIDVPAEWVMQGFTVPADTCAAYWREFELPGDWAGGRTILRFDSVHSDCSVWVNGQAVGAHEGGFTAFEFDISAAVRPGTNTLALAVRNESIADVLASASQYAAHQLGGITRKVTLFVVPVVHIAEQTIVTSLDAQFVDATLSIDLRLANDGATSASPGVAFSLSDPDGVETPVSTAALAPIVIPPGEAAERRFEMRVARPRKWDPEHPNLYTLRTRLTVDGRPGAMLAQRVGFRQVEVRGNEVLLNGRPIKLRGVNRHETHPLLGRSLTPELWRQDAELFRGANVNYIRTSHYPPAEEFLDACDELGLLVEAESALCWVQHGANENWQKWNSLDSKYLPFLLRANLENVAFNCRHPSVIIWSLANESAWSPLFATVLARVRQVDQTRLTSFHDQCWGEYNNHGSTADLANYHYPGTNGPAEATKGSRPTLFGEYAHINTYNRRELAADPGVRDEWGRRFDEMYDLMWRHTGCLGGAIWAGIDDIFLLPDGRTVGYGPWGIIDGWRRPKPEYWHVMRAYSPVRVQTQTLPADGQRALRVAVENRYDFTNFSELQVEWTLGDERGNAHADIPPHDTGEIVVETARTPRAGDALALRFHDPRGFVCHTEELPIGTRSLADIPPVLPDGQTLQLTAADEAFTVSGDRFGYVVDRRTGQIRAGTVGGRPVLVGGPVLMLLPLRSEECRPDFRPDVPPWNPVCTNWRATSVRTEQADREHVTIIVDGRYDEAVGAYRLVIGPDGGLDLSYEFAVAQPSNPRQAGVVFYVERSHETLSWQRLGYWTTYPGDHIGRLVGSATCGPALNAGRAGPRREPPGQPWALDATPFGTNDFRSSKTNLWNAALRAADGHGILLKSDGRQTARAFVDDDRIGWLIACASTGGGDMFFAGHHGPDRRPLAAGATLKDTVRLRLLSP